MLYRLLAIFILLSSQMPAFAVQDFTVTRQELALMPPYCTAYFGHFFGLPKLQDSPLRNTIPAGCPSLHHYCDGLKAMLRGNSNMRESKYWAGIAVRVFEGMAQLPNWASCPLRPEAYVNAGKVLLRQRAQGGASSGEAVVDFRKALELNPDYLAAYYALSDYYVDLGDKKKALSVVNEGLRHVPHSKGLLRRFKELGGKTPPTPIMATTKPDSPKAAKDSSAAQQRQNAVENGSFQPSGSATTSTQNAETVEATSPKIGSPTNPWCRFCPPE